MRHTTRLGAVVAALVFAGIAFADAAPKLRIAGRSPLRLTGSGFLPAEKVAIEVEYRGEDYVTKTRATDAGTFVAAFPGLRIGRCGHDVGIGAIGSRGSRFRVTLH